MKAFSVRLILALNTQAFRLSLLTASLIAMGAALLAGYLLVQASSALTQEAIATLRAQAQGFVALEQSGGLEKVRVSLAERSQVAGPDIFLLTGADGVKLAGNLDRWPPELETTPLGGVIHYLGPGRNATPRLAIGLPVAMSGGARLLVARDVEGELSFLDRVRSLMIVGLVATVGAGVIAGLVAGRAVLKRLDSINQTSAMIMAGNLSERIQVPTTGPRDELDALAVNLNGMLERIEQLITGMREISDNIAHDLKTPLSRLRNRAEAALASGGSRLEGSDSIYRHGLESTIEAADELIKTFNSLLLIARLEAKAVEDSLETFDLAALLADVVELYAPFTEEHGARLELRVEPAAQLSVLVRANRQLISQAVTNLIDNALKYGTPSPQGQHLQIGIGLEVRALEVCIRVADNGPGIPAADRERALKRFVRLDASRTRPGTGLGLSLVAAVARLHGGRLELSDNGPGLIVTLSLPMGTFLKATSQRGVA